MKQLLWMEIEECHSQKGRHYHNLNHLQHLLQELVEVKDQIQDWELILFTLYYHDSVYNPRKSDNEERSAELAIKRMKELSMPINKIERCRQQILATKSHHVSKDADANYFTDADLSILGQEWSKYEQYAQNVRKEYAMYPDHLYKVGRKKVLHHFLEMEHIFKTKWFHDQYETRAKNNLQRELKSL